MPLGERIRELREERDVSLRELAKKLGWSAPFLSDVELGRRYPSEKNLKELADLLETSLVALKAHDTRAPIEEIKRLSAEDPRYAMAFRTMINRNLSAEDLLRFAEGMRHSKRK